MNDFTQLKSQLKILKLSGALENLDMRVLEAKQNQLAYSEFLSMLLSDEIELRQMRKVARLIQKAGLGSEKTLENFDFSFNPSIPAPKIRELATCRFIDRGEGIFFIGPTGTGKTHLAKALCHSACRKHYCVAFYSFHQFFNKLEQAAIAGREFKLIQYLSNVDLLAIDDFGFKKLTQQAAEFLYAIVDARFGHKSIILTSNRAINDWLNIFPDPVIANTILDRVAHHSFQFIIKGQSYRKNFKPKFENA